jgi:hypothetical protein
MNCVKCGKRLASPTEPHDCKGIRERAAKGVSSDVERLRQRNEDALKKLGAPGRKADPRAIGLPGGSIIE